MENHEPRWKRKAQERPAALFEAALKSFTQHGYRATRLESIAEAAGVSKGTIYHYFENKNDLLMQAMEFMVEKRLEEYNEYISFPHSSSEEKLVYVLQKMWNRWQSEEWIQFQRFLMGEVSTEFPDFAKEWKKRGPVQSWNLIRDILEQGQRCGEFRMDFDPFSASKFIISGLIHPAILSVKYSISAPCTHSKDESYLENVLQLFLHAIRVQSKESTP